MKQHTNNIKLRLLLILFSIQITQCNSLLQSLRAAVTACELNTFRRLVLQCPASIISNPVTESKETLLHLVAAMHYRPVPTINESNLITRGFNPNLGRNNPAMRERYLEMAQMLLERGANPNAGLESKTPLHCAADKDDVMCGILLAHGAKVDDCTQRITPLGLAVEAGCLGANKDRKTKICNLLVNAGARLDSLVRLHSMRSVVGDTKQYRLIQLICEDFYSNHEVRDRIAKEFVNRWLTAHELNSFVDQKDVDCAWNSLASDFIETTNFIRVSGKIISENTAITDTVVPNDKDDYRDIARINRKIDKEKLAQIRANNSALYLHVRNQLSTKLERALIYALHSGNYANACQLITDFNADMTMIKTNNDKAVDQSITTKTFLRILD